MLALAVVTSPFAQKPADKAPAQKDSAVASLRHVEGNVLVSQKEGLTSAGESLRLEDGSRVITTANGRAIVAYDDGCEVTLEPNQRIEIRSDKECAARLAESSFKDPAGLALAPEGVTGAALMGSGPGILGTVGLVGLGALIISRGGTTASPN